MYQRVMREARERVECTRKKENLRRSGQGLEELPDESIKQEIAELCTELFEEIEDRKKYFDRLDQAYKRKKAHDADKKKAQEEIIQEDVKAWEENREQRVASWREFSTKKAKIEKKKKIKFGVHAPPLKAEERPVHAAPLDHGQNKPMGLQDDYKKKWR